MNQLINRFCALGIHAHGRNTKIGIIRSLFSQIENVKADGYDYGLILTELIQHGFAKTTRNEFYGLLNRIRLERGHTLHSRPKTVEHEVPCQSKKLPMYSSNPLSESTTSRTSGTMVPVTLDDLRNTSRDFEVDPSHFD